MKLLEINNLSKIYTTRLSSQSYQALNNVSFSVENGEFVAIMGESGSGKTTLLNIVSTLDHPTEGNVLLNGKNLSEIKNKDISAFRRSYLGFVFQDFNLLDNFLLKDNIILPLVLSRVPLEEIMTKLEKISRSLGILELLEKFPYEVSGGQKQRAAIARALITEPSLLVADEPTGALDSKSAKITMDIFSEFNKAGQTILMVTHSTKAASFANRVLFIKDGSVYNQIYRGNLSTSEFMEKITDTLTVISNRGDENGY